MSDLRDRIANAIAQADGDEPGMAPASCDYEMADAIGDYQYVCHPCGSSFSFYSSSTMQQFALMHSGSHNPKSTGADTVGDVNDD